MRLDCPATDLSLLVELVRITYKFNLGAIETLSEYSF